MMTGLLQGKAGLCDENPKPDSIITALQTAALQGKVIYGHQDDLCYGHTWIAAPDGDPVKSDVKDVCGDYPAILGLDLSGIECGDAENIDGVPFDLMRKAAIRHYERGGMVTFSWHVNNPLTGDDSWDVSSKKVVAYILDDAEGKEKFNEWLGRCADFLLSLQTEDGEVIPVIFRPWHEHTGSWFWWGRDLCTADEYVRLWRQTYEYLVCERGLKNMAWEYSPGAVANKKDYMERYPGDEYVDILGVDCYQYGEMPQSAKTFNRNVRTALKYLTKLGAEHGKPIAIAETGYEGIAHSQWWTQALMPAISGFPVSYVLTWRNAHNRPAHYYAPWPGSADADDFKVFHSLPETVFLNDLKL